ncbi:hypothetical protein FB567DRAFT_603944 [Paraphoma chrysanthemicola]|uniref:Uncharacterized protein n=1 Tax=Paraphoma chrysanthemicola TaxID=798071 RepID=A0A8K0R1K0_9PLEO|nr:hypothetical protein FB567DRAFT_603944 [Paraphoma chrysanthemicola]
MVSFTTLLTSALALAAPIAAQSTPAQTISTLNTLTSKTQALQPIANSISAVNGVLLVIGQGPFPPIIQGLQEISSIAANAVNQQNGAPQTPAGADADAVFNAYRTFATEHQSLLNTLTDKAALFSTVPVIGGPVAAILRVDESAIDSLTLSIINTTPSRVQDFTPLGQSLAKAFQTAINAYSGALQKRAMKFGTRAEAVAA